MTILTESPWSCGNSREASKNKIRTADPLGKCEFAHKWAVCDILNPSDGTWNFPMHYPFKGVLQYSTGMAQTLHLTVGGVQRHGIATRFSF